VFQADESAFLNSGTWGEQLLGEELSQKAQLAAGRTYLLTERIKNDDLRKEVKAFRDLVTQVSRARNKSAAESALNKMISGGNSVNESIGNVLRSLYIKEGIK
jgi:hypothetical protein